MTACLHSRGSPDELAGTWETHLSGRIRYEPRAHEGNGSRVASHAGGMRSAPVESTTMLPTLEPLSPATPSKVRVTAVYDDRR